MKEKEFKEIKKEITNLREALRVKYCNFKEEIEHFGEVVVSMDKFLESLEDMMEDKQ